MKTDFWHVLFLDVDADCMSCSLSKNLLSICALFYMNMIISIKYLIKAKNTKAPILQMLSSWANGASVTVLNYILDMYPRVYTVSALS
jgi:hypothetical protein